MLTQSRSLNKCKAGNVVVPFELYIEQLHGFDWQFCGGAFFQIQILIQDLNELFLSFTGNIHPSPEETENPKNMSKIQAPAIYIHQFIRQRQKHSFSYQLQYINLSVPLSWVTWYWVGVSFFLKSSLLKLFGQTFCFALAPVGGSAQKKFKIGCADTGCWYQVTILLRDMSSTGTCKNMLIPPHPHQY